MDYKDIIVEEKGPVVTIWFNHPERKNAISTPMTLELIHAMKSYEMNTDVKAIILRGKGHTWCAGHYLAEHEDSLLGGGNKRQGAWRLLKRTTGELTQLFDYTPQITCVVVEGFAVAGGFELMMLADLAICTEEAKIGDYHLNRSLWGAAGPLWSVPRAIGMRKAKDLMLSGKLLTGKQAYEYGLVCGCYPSAKLEESIEEYIAPFINKGAYIQRLGKMCLNRSFEGSKETMSVLEQMLGLLVYESDDAKEGVDAFMQKRKPVWKNH